MAQLFSKNYTIIKINIEYYVLFAVTFILFVMGIIMISSTSMVFGQSFHNDPFWFIRRQIIWAVFSFIALVVFSKIDYHKYSKISNFIILITIGILAVVLTPGVGLEIAGATRWINLLFFTVQPSEFAKIGIILYLSDILNKKYRNIYRIKAILLPAFIFLLLITFLIFLQPDFSTVIVIWTIIFIILYIGGVRFTHILALGFTWLLFTVFYFFMENYRMQRLFSFLDRSSDQGSSNFQITQSLIALGSGHITGVGLGNSMQKYSYLPEANTDFIFAIIGEELGLVGTSAIVVLFLIFTFFGIRVCLKANDYFGRLIAVGITSLITVQALVNIMVTTGLVPVTGLTLPFISLGGSSLLANMIGVGILLNISKYKIIGKKKIQRQKDDSN